MVNTLSLRARLTIWYTLALVVVLALFGADVVWVQGRLGVRRLDQELDAVHATLANALGAELKELDSPELAATEARDTVATPGRAVAVFDARGTMLAARLDGLDRSDLVPDRAGRAVRTITARSGEWRVHAEPETFGGTTLTLVVASPLAGVRHEQHGLQEAMFVGFPIALLLAGAGGLWLASVGLRPISEMAQRAARLPPTGEDDLGHSDRTDELGQLARAFNALVARLRAALRTEQQFMADASHELRTPVSVVRTAADVTLAREHREEAEYRDALAIAGEQAKRLGRLVEDMLVLARADAGGYPLRPVDLYLDEVIEECRRAVDLLAAERGVTLRTAVADGLPFRGDEDLLRRLMLNVLQNAVQHTPRGGTVVVSTSRDPDAIRIRVADTGRGIAPADRARIFDRFVQLDPSRRAEGTGLGLPIAKWIAEAHGGALALEASGDAGSTFCVSLPHPPGPDEGPALASPS